MKKTLDLHQTEGFLNKDFICACYASTMEKDFDTWNGVKKLIDAKTKVVFCNSREIWWASLGLNIGSEEDGKNDLFERPVLVIKVFNRHMVRAIPLTSRLGDGKHHVTIVCVGSTSSVVLSQLKTLSTKRLTRKIGRLDEAQFSLVIQAVKDHLSP